MTRSILAKLMFSASLLAMATAAQAAGRVALVIGNSAYQSQSKLANPQNDAADVAALLRKLGFDVVEGRDLSFEGFRRKRQEFTDKVEEMSTGWQKGQPKGVALFYYSGHGMQHEGQNFVLPTDAKVEKPADLKRNAVDLDLILEEMQGEGRINIVVLDACRDNPFAKSLAKVTRAAENAYGGLAAPARRLIDAFVIYSTDPGNVALDGEGDRNSPFTRAFLNTAGTPGLDLSTMMIRIRDEVFTATGDRQAPWEKSSLRDVVFLAGEGEGLVQTAALTTGAGPIGGTTRGLTAPPVPAPGQRPAAAPPAPPAAKAPERSAAELAGEGCDATTTDQEDPMRSPTARYVRHPNAEVAIPACEAAVAANPKVLRYQYQLARAYSTGKRREDALKLFRATADRGSAYATAFMGFYHYRGWGGLPKDYPQARAWFEKAGAMGVKNGLSNLGYMYAHGIGGPADMQKALQYLNRGVALNHVNSLVTMGDLHLEGRGMAKDTAKAKELYLRAAELGEADAMIRLGTMLLDGKDAKPDYEEARRWFQKAAAEGAAAGMFQIGYLYYQGTGGVPQDNKRAFEWFSRAANLQDQNGLNFLGHMYLNGVHVPKDVKKGLELTEEAALHDNTAAMRTLAEFAAEGTHGPVDREKAKYWLGRASDLGYEPAREALASFDRQETPAEACDRLAAAKDDPLRPAAFKPADNLIPAKAIPACQAAVAAHPGELRFANQLGWAYVWDEKYVEAMAVMLPAAEKKSAYAALWVGNMHKRALGAPKNLDLARHWYEKGAEYGSMNAMYNLGRMYKDADGMPENLPLARKFFEQAAKLNEPSSYTDLGHLAYTGKGEPKDYVRARGLYEKAAELGERVAMHQLGEIYREGFGVVEDARAARLWHGRAASAGDVDSMRALAILYLTAAGGDKDTEKARGLLEQAAGNNNVKAMNTLAQGHLAGVFDGVNAEEARRWYGRAAELGDADARRAMAATPGMAPDPEKQGADCDRLAGNVDDPLRSISHPPTERVEYKTAIPACEAAVEAFPETLRYANQLGRGYVAAGRWFDALRVYRKAAEEGSTFATLWVGNLYARGNGVPKDEAEGAVWYEKAAELGSIVGMYNLALHHLNLASEKGTPDKDAAAALKWLETAAGHGMADAMFRLAKIYERGKLAPQDRVKQIEWLKKAVEFNHGPALSDLGHAYITGAGVAKDEKAGRAFSKRGADVGSLTARHNYAHTLLFGLGGPADTKLARELLEKNAAVQHVESIIYLGLAENAGMFGKPDRAAVRRHYERAADLGNAEAKDLLAKLK